METNPEIEAEGPHCPSELGLAGQGTWEELRWIGEGWNEAPNTLWPQCNGATPVRRKFGDGAVAGYVAEHSGTIGFADLPDAKNKGDEVASIQNQGGLGVTFAYPEGRTGETANCGGRTFTVPPAGREGASGVAVSWYDVFGAEPEIGSTLYPLCTLTYDLTWTSYSAAGYPSPASRAEDVKAYINYILNEGQHIGHYYQALPRPGVVTMNVLGAAKLAASHIG